MSMQGGWEGSCVLRAACISCAGFFLGLGWFWVIPVMSQILHSDPLKELFFLS